MRSPFPISTIRNVLLRRGVLLLTAIPVLAFAIVAGAVCGAVEMVADWAAMVRIAWRGR